LSSLVASDAVRLEADLMATHDGNGARNTLIFARTVLNAAYRDRIIERSPFDGVKLRRPRNRREVVLPTWEVVRAVVEGRTARTTVRMTVRQSLIAVMAGSGLREGEVLGLTMDSIDFLRKEITVKRSLNFLRASNALKAGYANGGFYVKEAKSEAGQGRVVPVAQWTLDVLAAWLTENPPQVEEVPRDRPDGTTMVRVAPIFGMVKGDTASSLVRDARWGTGVKYSPHDLRKLFATELEQSGLPYTSVQAILGHAPVSVTGLYVQVTEKSLDQARDILTAAWEGASGVTAGGREDVKGVETG
jgi:integrase